MRSGGERTLTLRATHFDDRGQVAEGIRALRWQRYQNPIGVQDLHDGHGSVWDLRDDKDDSGIQISLAAETSDEDQVRCTVASTLRLSLPAVFPCLEPLGLATAGRWVPPFNTGTFGRAASSPSYGGLELYAYLVAETMILAHTVGLDHLAALFADVISINKPVLFQRLLDLGFEFYRLDSEREFGGIRVDMGDGCKKWHAIPAATKLNDENLKVARRIQAEIESLRFDPLGLSIDRSMARKDAWKALVASTNRRLAAG